MIIDDPNQPISQSRPVECLDARYDNDEGMLVLNCVFMDTNEQKLVIMHKDDFHFKQPGTPPPDLEMHRTAKMFKGKKFNLVIDSDPEREHISYQDYVKTVEGFVERIGKEMGDVSQGMVDDLGKMQRRLGDLAAAGKVDVKKLLSSELAIRARMGQ